MFEIAKQFAFSAGHQLAGLPAGHKCGRPHGHSYLVEVRVSAATLDGTGFVADYADLSPFGAWLDEAWDHRWLGYGTITDAAGTKHDPVFEGNPTAELLAARFRGWILDGGLPVLAGAGVAEVTVGVSETPKTWAWAR